MRLHEVMEQDWAKPTLDYLATTQHAIASRFEESCRYVSLHHKNANAFSYEFASILRDACSAFGSFSGAVVQCLNPKNKDPKIAGFFDLYSLYAPEFPKDYIDVVVLSGPRRRLQPFCGWTRGKPPAWWSAYNKVKHSEYKHAEEGNLQNATNAVAAVEIILRRATLNRKGTGLFSPWGCPWDPGEPGTRIQRLFYPP